MWTLDDGVALCKLIESFCPVYSCHVAMTGGTLYKEGARKDLDLLFYRIRGRGPIDRENLLLHLRSAGITLDERCGWVFKATYRGKSIDLMFPEETAQWSRGSSIAYGKEPTLLDTVLRGFQLMFD